jgi:PAS domain S-box-containing protein
VVTPLRVLIVEDRPADAELMLYELHREGFVPEWWRVETEADFLAQLQCELDLILSDYSLPQFDGLRALQLVQKQGLDIPFIVLTGTSNEEIAVECMKQGAADYLLKDRPARLGLAVKQALQKKRLRDEQRRAEQALRESEERYRSLFENALEGIFRRTPEGQFTHVNPALVRMLGYTSAAEVLALHLPDDLYMDYAQWESLSTQYSDHRVIEGAELVWKKKNGEPIIVSLYARAIPDAQGRVVAYEGMVVDITQRKRAEDALRESEEKFRTLAEQSPNMIFINKKGRVVYANKMCEEVMGYRKEEFYAPDFNFLCLIAPESVDLIKANFRQHLRGEEVAPYEYGLMTKAGKRIDSLITTKLIAYEGESAILGIVTDITARKRAEVALQQEAEIAAALARVGRELIASLETPAILERLCQLVTEVLNCDCCHTVLWQPDLNAYKAVAGYGHTPEEWETLQTIAVPREIVADVLAQLEREEVMQVDTSAYGAFLPAVALQRMGIMVSLWIALRRGGEVIGGLSAGYRGPGGVFSPLQKRLARGVGQLASLALENARLLEQAQRANRLKSEFLATMSHELRTPLNIIMGYTDLLLEADFGPLSTDQADAVRRVHRSAQDLCELIAATLDVSRLEAGRMPVGVSLVSLPELINEVEAETRELLREKPGISFTRRMAAGLPLLRTDRTKLKVILKNLLSNAVKFTEQGHITLDIYPQAGGVELAVTDTGIGIAPQVLPNIFDMFRQGDGSATRAYSGVGLGLYIVQRLLDLLHGTVTVESEVGRGSVFRVWVPREIPLAS